MEQIMNKLKKMLNTIKKKTGFYQGLALGLVITSTLSYAVVTFTTFTAGTPISSTDMNTNFAAIKAKLDSLDVGMSGKLAADLLTNCFSMPVLADYTVVPMVIGTTDGNYDSVNFIYTVPETAIYRLYAYGNTGGVGSIQTMFDTSIDGGTTWTQNTLQTMSRGSIVEP